MISYPTTEQIILDCRRELLEVIGVEVTSDAAKVSVQMVENVLRNVAMRAAHEIAWMREETAVMELYVNDVLVAIPGAPGVAGALAALGDGPGDSLFLNDVTRVYTLAGEAMSCAVEAALAAGHTELSSRAAALLTERNVREQQIMGEWGFVGRG